MRPRCKSRRAENSASGLCETHDAVRAPPRARPPGHWLNGCTLLPLPLAAWQRCRQSALLTARPAPHLRPATTLPAVVVEIGGTGSGGRVRSYSAPLYRGTATVCSFYTPSARCVRTARYTLHYILNNRLAPVVYR